MGPGGRGVYLDFADSISRLGESAIRERYGNLFQMYERITGENAYKRPMRIYPAIHYTMGGLLVDYNLQSTVPGCFVLGEANFSDHGANRLGASALMQGLSDGYFVIPYTVGNYLASSGAGTISPDGPEVKEVLESVKERTSQLLSISGKKIGPFLPQRTWTNHVGICGYGPKCHRASKSNWRNPRFEGSLSKKLTGTRHW